MLRTRVIPCLLLKGWGLVKTVHYQQPNYVGDPINIVRIFNELEVDELVFLDIAATPGHSDIQYSLLGEIAGECFMPFTYGGGIRSRDDAARVFALGSEKVVLNTAAFANPGLVSQIAARYGSQAVVVSLDVRKELLRGYRAFTHGGRRRLDGAPEQWARRMEEAGAGEILLNAIHRDGDFQGYDIELIRAVSSAVSIPVIASGGASCVDDLRRAKFEGGASALAVGSMVVYQGANRAVLTNFPDRDKLREALEPHPSAD